VKKERLTDHEISEARAIKSEGSEAPIPLPEQIATEALQPDSSNFISLLNQAIIQAKARERLRLEQIRKFPLASKRVN